MPTETTAEDQNQITANNSGKPDIATAQSGDAKRNMSQEEMDVSGSSIPNTSMTSAQLANDLRESRKGNLVGANTGYGSLPGFSPTTLAVNAIGALSIENMAKAIEKGGLPVYSTDVGNKRSISVGYRDGMNAKDLVGVQHSGLFGGTVYSGQNAYNPSNFNKDGSYTDPFDTNESDSRSTVIGTQKQSTQMKKKTQKQTFAKAVNKNPQEQMTRVRKPKASGGEFEDGGALVRRTKTLQSDKRGILGKPDTGKKTLLGA